MLIPRNEDRRARALIGILIGRKREVRTGLLDKALQGRSCAHQHDIVWVLDVMELGPVTNGNFPL